MRDASPLTRALRKYATLLRAETRATPMPWVAAHVACPVSYMSSGRSEWVVPSRARDLLERTGAAPARQRERSSDVFAERGARVDFVDVGVAPAAPLDYHVFTTV